MSVLRSRATVQASFSGPSRVACSAKLNQVLAIAQRPVRRQAVVKPSLNPPADQSELLDFLPVGSALFGYVVAPILLDLAGVPDPAWWQTILTSIGAGLSTVVAGILGTYIHKTNLSKQQREDLLKDRTLLVELQKSDNGSYTSAGKFQSPTVYVMASATNNEAAQLTKYLQTVAEDIFGEKYEGGVLLGVDAEGTEARLLLRPGTTVEGVLVTSLKGLVLRVKKVD